DLESAKDIRDEVLARMETEGTLTTEQVAAAQAEEIVLRPPDKRLATGSYVLQAVFDTIEERLSEEQIKAGGLRIHTTIDPELQASAEKALEDHLASIESRSGFRHPKKGQHADGSATRYLQGSVVSLDNSDGGILALVGGRDFGDSPFNRAYKAARQCGSTFKSFVYAAAFDKSGLLPGAYIDDGPISVDTGSGRPWRPSNSDGTFTGLQPAAIGLIRSRNTMSVRVGQIAGVPTIQSLAKALKFGEIPDGQSIFLGSFDTSNLILTSAYSTFPAKGVNYSPYLVSRIETAAGEIFLEQPTIQRTVFPESIAYITSDILGEVMRNGTGASTKRLGYTAPSHGKTGTTNDYRDAWFVGFTDKITTGVWVGLDQPETIMDRGYGSTLALPIWTEVMKTAESSGYAAAPLPAPPGTTPTILCRECNKLASDRTRYPYQMNLPPDLRPTGYCNGHNWGLFSNRDEPPRAFPIPGQPQLQQPPPEEQGGLLRGLGRLIFGPRR
ncbi:MAG: penicillin-binding transpeptidase domain-containing protein, partial [Verrucomicrobiota bacterium]